jgi:predicted nucleotidyltransferase
MITEKQLKIIEVFRKNIGKKIMFNDIKKTVKIKSNSFLQKALLKFKKEGVIESEKIGKSIIYSINLNNKTMAYFSLIASELYDLPEKAIYSIIKEVSKKTSFFSLIVFGSYAKKENKKGSDLDIVIIVEENRIIKEISPLIESIKRKEIINIDCQIFTSKEFIEMLNAEKENVGKEIIRNHIVFYNPYSFYTLIKQWIR